MPLVQTKYGGECPLGKFEIDVPAGGGCYTSDPVEACFGCNFADPDIPNDSGFEPAKICKCPADMTRAEYKHLIGAYILYTRGDPDKPNKKDFQKFVRKNRDSLASRLNTSPSK